MLKSFVPKLVWFSLLLSTFGLAFGAHAQEAEGELVITDYAVFSILYSAGTGRALAGMIDRFGAARFADCEAPRGSSRSSIDVTELSRCHTVPGSLFMLTPGNLKRIHQQLPGRMATSFAEAFDPVGVREVTLTRAAIWTGLAVISVASILIENRTAIANGQNLFRSVLKGRLRGKYAMVTAAGSLFALFKEFENWRHLGRFPSLERLLRNPMGTVILLPNSNVPIPVNNTTLPHVYDILRRGVLGSILTLPSV